MTPTPTATKSCLDAEALAAWVDGGLDARAAAMAEAHVSSCPRCQEIAGLMVKTMPAVEVTAGLPRRSFSVGGFRAGWLIPLTASVAAVGLWMIVPADRATVPPAPPAAVAETKVAQAPPADQAQSLDQLKQKAQATPAEEFRAKEQGARARELGAKNEAPKLLAKQDKDQKEKRFDEANADANKLRDQFAPVPPTAPATATAAAPAPAERAAVSAAPAASAMEAGRLEAQAPARKAFAQAAAREARSPDGSIRWRLTPTNTLERSTDNGQTWVPVETGAGGPLASVQAVDAKTAIVTTVDGRQLRTLDAGVSWNPIK